MERTHNLTIGIVWANDVTQVKKLSIGFENLEEEIIILISDSEMYTVYLLNCLEN